MRISRIEHDKSFFYPLPLIFHEELSKMRRKGRGYTWLPCFDFFCSLIQFQNALFLEDFRKVLVRRVRGGGDKGRKETKKLFLLAKPCKTNSILTKVIK